MRLYSIARRQMNSLSLSSSYTHTHFLFALSECSGDALDIDVQLDRTMKSLTGEGAETEHGTCEQGDFFSLNMLLQAADINAIKDASYGSDCGALLRPYT